jgi:hypothetical protein
MIEDQEQGVAPPYTTVENPRFGDNTGDVIIVDVRFAELGPDPVPFAARADAKDSYVAELYAQALGGSFGEVGAYTVAVGQVPSTITRVAAARQLLRDNMITGTEMVAMASIAAIPSRFTAQVNALSTADKWTMQARFANVEYARVGSTLTELLTGIRWTSARTDTFFRNADLL